MRRALPFSLAVAVAALCCGGEAESLRTAIAHAQQRCVRIYGGAAGREHGYATGILASADGLILAAQGIYLTEGRLRVILPGGSRHDAEVLRRSDELQTALLKINARTPQFFELSVARPVRQGDWVVAVSNVFNVASADEALSATLGIVSLRAEMEARHRTQDVPYEGEMLLIDAITSNPGAPGGALCTLDGRLIGMLGKLFHSESTGARLNYAVPVDRLKAFVEGQQAPATEAPKSPPGGAYVGLRLFTLSGKAAPAYVDRVAAGSPAAEAGLQKDDLILSVAGEVVHNCRECEEALLVLPAGRPAAILVKRKNTIQAITLTPKPQQGGQPQQ